MAPSDVAMRQRAWDRRQLVLRMIDLGFTLAEIGRRLGISGGRVRVLASQGKRTRYENKVSDQQMVQTNETPSSI